MAAWRSARESYDGWQPRTVRATVQESNGLPAGRDLPAARQPAARRRLPRVGAAVRSDARVSSSYAAASIAWARAASSTALPPLRCVDTRGSAAASDTRASPAGVAVSRMIGRPAVSADCRTPRMS